MWTYIDRRGFEHTGTMKSYTDLGGTDMTYFMIDAETGELSVVSGSLINSMRRTDMGD